MKLYYSPGACSLSPHIALAESGVTYALERVDLKAKKTESGADFNEINPKGYVPALELDEGEILTEGPAIVQYIADQEPEKCLAPANGTLDRARLQEWLNFIGTELHKGFSPLFRPQTEEFKQQVRANLQKRLTWVDSQLAGRSYLLGDDFSVADGYLFTITRWSGPSGVDIAGLENLAAFMQRMSDRPAVQRALREEGLLK